MFELSPFVYRFNQEGHEKKIFSNATLKFHAQDSVLICGPSGGGKSTLLKILKGIIPEFSSGDLSGDILFHGKSLNGENFNHNIQKILYLFQNPFSQLLFPYAEEEFFFSMENMNFSPEQMDEKKAQLEKQFDLSNLWGKDTQKMSHGECQKLVFASLLAVDPEVLLLDEPTAFIDVNARREFYQHLQRLRSQKMLFIIDHHLTEVLPLVNRVIFIGENGEIKEIDKQQAVDLSLTETLKVTWPELTFNAQKKIAAITLNNLSFNYEEQQILNDVSCTLKKGETVVITGKNGAGKSTLVKLMAGLLKPKSGTLHYQSGEKKLKPDVNLTNFIFQNPESHFYFDTIKEEIDYSLKNISAEKRTELTNAFFHQIDLNRSPFLLSEGEKRRLSILISVFHYRSVYFYDEPTFGQDSKSKKQIAHLMNFIKQQDAIQIVISHDEEFIKEVADRLLTLVEGKLIESKN